MTLSITKYRYSSWPCSTRSLPVQISILNRSVNLFSATPPHYHCMPREYCSRRLCSTSQELRIWFWFCRVLVWLDIELFTDILRRYFIGSVTSKCMVAQCQRNDPHDYSIYGILCMLGCRVIFHMPFHINHIKMWSFKPVDAYSSAAYISIYCISMTRSTNMLPWWCIFIHKNIANACDNYTPKYFWCITTRYQQTFHTLKFPFES